MSATSEFAVTTTEAEAVVTMPARIDATNASAFLERVDALREAGHRDMILDLRATEILDSTALGAVMTLYRTLKALGGTLRLSNVGGGPMRVLQLTRLDRVLEVIDEAA
ncbi:MAG: STAS domain-containing protein [Myxococcota bacterium]